MIGIFVRMAAFYAIVLEMARLSISSAVPVANSVSAALENIQVSFSATCSRSSSGIGGSNRGSSGSNSGSGDNSNSRSSSSPLMSGQCSS